MRFQNDQRIQGSSSSAPVLCHLMLAEKMKSSIDNRKFFYPLSTMGSQQSIQTGSDLLYGEDVFSSVFSQISQLKSCFISWINNSLCDQFCEMVPVSLTDAFLLSSRVPTSAWQSLRRFTIDRNDLNSSQYVRKMGSNRWNICFFSVYWGYHSRSQVVFLCNNGSR